MRVLYDAFLGRRKQGSVQIDKVYHEGQLHAQRFPARGYTRQPEPVVTPAEYSSSLPFVDALRDVLSKQDKIRPTKC